MKYWNLQIDRFYYLRKPLIEGWTTILETGTILLLVSKARNDAYSSRYQFFVVKNFEYQWLYSDELDLLEEL